MNDVGMRASPLTRLGRWLPRAAAGSLVCLPAGAVAGAVLGALVWVAANRGDALVIAGAAAIAGAFVGGWGGLLLGPAIVVRSDRLRLAGALAIGALVGGPVGLVMGLYLSAPDPPGQSVKPVLYTVFSLIAGLLGGAAGSRFLGFVRSRWKWLTRWDGAD